MSRFARKVGWAINEEPFWSFFAGKTFQGVTEWLDVQEDVEILEPTTENTATVVLLNFYRWLCLRGAHFGAQQEDYYFV